jgi:predicted ATPase
LFEVGELLASLTDKSLVVKDEATGRYRMLETVRDYARVMLAAEGSVQRGRGRHLD